MYQQLNLAFTNKTILFIKGICFTLTVQDNTRY